MVEVREVLRGWLEGAGLRRVAERAGVDRKTARRYVAAAEAAGLVRDAGVEALSDELLGAVVAAVRPVRPNGHGAAWDLLLARQDQIAAWVKGGPGQDALSVVKIEELLARQGCVVPYRTLHRFAVERCGFRVRSTTVRINDGEPGVECQIDFAQMGFILDPETGRKRRVHALIFTAVVSRHMFVWLTYSQTLVAMIAGCEAAWTFFGGVFKVLIPDNLKAVVTDADAVNPRLSVGWLDYAQYVGFATDPARVRSPQDKPRVERVVQYVRGNFWAGETFADLADAQARVEVWCAQRAGMRIHGTTAARPVEMFNEVESSCLLAVPEPYDVPVFTRVKVHRDFHVEVARALYWHCCIERSAGGAAVNLSVGRPGREPEPVSGQPPNASPARWPVLGWPPEDSPRKSSCGTGSRCLNATVPVAVLLAVLSISVLVYFIHHISDSVQVWTLAERVRADLLGTVDRLYPDDAGEADGEGTGGPAAEKVADRDGEALTSLETGYGQGVDAAGLMAVAAEHDLVVDLRVRPGEYVTQGAVVAVLRPADQVDENGRTSVRQAIRVGRARTPEEDVGFPALLLEEMAVRALSPSTNDPYTAINALDNLATGLVALADRPMPSPFRYDSQGLLRVIAPRASLIDVLEHVLDAMRFYAVAHPTVLHRTLDLIAQVGGAAHDVTVMPRLDAHVRDLVDAFSATSPQGRDLEELNRHASRVRQGLSARREPHA